MSDDLSHLYKFNSEVSFRVHWLGVTVHAPFSVVRDMCAHYFLALTPEHGYVDCGHGGMGFKESVEGLCGFRIYHHMRGIDTSEKFLASGGEEVDLGICHVSLTGQACDCISHFDIYNFLSELSDLSKNSGLRWRVTRLDFAFDGVPFSPHDMYQAFLDDREDNRLVTVWSERSSLTYFVNPFQLQEGTDKLGCATCQIGSRSSERMLRVYNYRGFTRCELQLRDDRADVIAKFVFVERDAGLVAVNALRCLCDYIEFNTDWWRRFVYDTPKAMMKPLHGAKPVTVKRSLEWLRVQVAPTLKALHVGGIIPSTPFRDVLPSERLHKLLGTVNRSSPDETLLAYLSRFAYQSGAVLEVKPISSE